MLKHVLDDRCGDLGEEKPTWKTPKIRTFWRSGPARTRLRQPTSRKVELCGKDMTKRTSQTNEVRFWMVFDQRNECDGGRTNALRIQLRTDGKWKWAGCPDPQVIGDRRHGGPKSIQKLLVYDILLETLQDLGAQNLLGACEQFGARKSRTANKSKEFELLNSLELTWKWRMAAWKTIFHDTQCGFPLTRPRGFDVVHLRSARAQASEARPAVPGPGLRRIKSETSSRRGRARARRRPGPCQGPSPGRLADRATS